MTTKETINSGIEQADGSAEIFPGIFKTESYSTGTALTDPLLDRFGRSRYASKIALAISQRKNKGSIVMGLYGTPGSGKTTLLNFIEGELGSTGNVTGIRFDPVSYQSESGLTKAFFEVLAGAGLDYSESPVQQELTALLSDYSEILTTGISSLARNTGEKTVQGSTSKHLSIKDLEVIKARIEKKFESADRHIAILIDNLDKLNKSELKAVFRLLKLHANFPNTIYVLTFDLDTAAIKLGRGYDETAADAGRKFLEKLIQVSINIPPFDRTGLEKYLTGAVSDVLAENNFSLSISGQKEFLRSVKNGFGIRLKSVSQCKEFRNTLSSVLPGVSSEVRITDVLLTEGIKVFYPAVYDAVINHPAVFNNNPRVSSGTEKEALSIIETASAEFSEGEKKSVTYLISTLFPAAFGYNETEVRSDSEEKNTGPENEAETSQFFDRYFTNQKVNNEEEINPEILLSILESAGAEVISEKVAQVAGSMGNEALVNMLMERSDEISEAGSINLISALGLKGSSFENPDSLFSFTTVFSHPGIVIHDLLEKITEKKKRFDTAAELIVKSEPVSFAFEAYRWMCEPDEAGEARLFTATEEEQLGRMLAERIAYFNYGQPLYIKAPQDAPFLLDAWSYLAGREVTSNYLLRSFMENKENIISFLRCYMPGENSDLNDIYDIRLDQFNSIGKVIDHKDLFTSLLDSTGEEFLSESAETKDISTLTAAKFAKAYKNFVPVRNTQSAIQSGKRNESTAFENRRKFVQVKKGIYRPFSSDLDS